MSQKIKVTCEMEITLRVIGGKWKPLIIHYLQEEGPKRYNQILRFLERAPKKTLTSQLRELEEDGIVERKVYPTVPIQVEYSVTKQGETLYPILEMMCNWGSENEGDKYEVMNRQCYEE
ncbi:transcriptional regulator [Sporanaerobium hydrogeniformans]|uniref:Transcriptional regulator n=1 Tax=Sporanaerobium hydrogeniformans TaxID=3072179 RepID=A0AC61DD97_9FIRM|nr:helix-turn-helix domain-containing protein [Sporanaerobium hydrogeniformans]PHV71294.1 transcriptional regulator [Sporanaerobium hydrogeniformans]